MGGGVCNTAGTSCAFYPVSLHPHLRKLKQQGVTWELESGIMESLLICKTGHNGLLFSGSSVGLLVRTEQFPFACPWAKWLFSKREYSTSTWAKLYYLSRFYLEISLKCILVTVSPWFKGKKSRGRLPILFIGKEENGTVCGSLWKIQGTYLP